MHSKNFPTWEWIIEILYLGYDCMDYSDYGIKIKETKEPKLVGVWRETHDKDGTNRWDYVDGVRHLCRDPNPQSQLLKPLKSIIFFF